MKPSFFNSFWRVSAYLLLTFLMGCNLSTPEPTVFLADNIDKWKTHFKAENEELWTVSDGKLVFTGSEEISKLTVPLDSLPSEMLKPKRLTASVEVNGIFSDEDSNSFYGFELYQSGADSRNRIKFGLTGAGNLVAFDHNMLPLPIKVSKLENCTPKPDNNDVLLYFAMYGSSKKGWVINCIVKNCEEENLYSLRTSIVTGTKAKIDELSLVAYKPATSNTPVWFSNLKIWKDWVPFD